MRLNAQTVFFTLTAFVGVVVLCAIFFMTGYTAGQKVGLEGAKQRLAGYLPDSISSVTTFDGTVKEVRDNTLVVTVGAVSANPLDPQGPGEREVIVSASTVMLEKSPKTSAQINEEESAYQLAVSQSKSATAPLPYALTPLTLPEMKAGDRVRVNANENIYFATSFTATEVQRLR